MTHSDHVVAMETVSDERLRAMLVGLEGLDGGLTYQLPGDIRSIISELLASRLAKQAPVAWISDHSLELIERGESATVWPQEGGKFKTPLYALPAAPSPVLGEPK